MPVPGDSLPNGGNTDQVDQPAPPQQAGVAESPLLQVIRILEQELDQLRQLELNFQSLYPEDSTAGRTFRAERETQHVAIISNISQALTKAVAVRAVIAGHLSKKRASELLRVHQATIARWVAEHRAQTALDDLFKSFLGD